MKKPILSSLFPVAMLALATSIPGAKAETFTFTPAAAIPDGALPLGLTDTQAPATTINVIQGISLTLEIAGDPLGGWNGDLYAYVQHVTPGGSGFSVLLNRVGTTAGDRFGYGDSGLSVTFSDAAANDIHLYNSFTPVFNPSGQLTGTWQPDARTANPDTTAVGSVTDASSRTAFLTSGANAFTGLSAKGDWTVFLSDGSTGSAMTLTSWTLDITGISGPFYWKGQTDTAWNTIGDHISNWAADPAGTPLYALPLSTDDVIFSATGAANQNTTLGQDFTIKSLTIQDSAAVTINSGTGGPFTLTLSGNSGTGIDVQAGAGAVNIGANVTLAGSSDTITVNNTGGLTISGALGGANGLNKLGTGTLTLSGNNAYTGNTTIDGGSLVVTGSVGNGTSTSDFTVGSTNGGTSLTISGGGVVTNGKTTIGLNAASDSNTVFLTGTGSQWNTSTTFYLGYDGAGNTMTVSDGAKFTLSNTSNTSNFDALIGANDGSDNNKLTVTGSGSQFTNVNTGFTSTLYVGRSGTGNSMEVLAGGKVDSFNARIGGGTGTNGTTNNNTVLVDGAGSLWNVGGTLRVGSDGTNSGLTISGGGVVNVTGNTFLGYNLASTGNTALVTGSGSQWNVASLVIGRNGGGTVTVADSGALSVTSITLGQFAGSTGTLQIGNGAGAGTVSNVGITTGLGMGQVVFNHTDSAYTFSNAISGTTSVLHKNTGTTTLSGASSYTGGTVISKGTLILDNSAAAGGFGNGTITLGDGSTGNSDVALKFGSGINSSDLTVRQGVAVRQMNPVTVANTGSTGTATIAFNSDQFIYTDIALNRATVFSGDGSNANARVFMGQITGPGAGAGNDTLTIDSGSGNWLLLYPKDTGAASLANTFTGNLHVKTGNLQIGNLSYIADTAANQNLVIPDTASVTVDAGSTLMFVWGDEAFDALNGGGTITRNIEGQGNRTLTIGASNGTGTFSGSIESQFNILKTGTGTETFSGTNTYGGTTTVNMGTLTLQNGAAIADLGAVTVTAPGTLNLASSETIGSLSGDGFVTLNANTLTTGGNNVGTIFSGVMSDAGGLVKEGLGVFTLTGANTFTGPVAVNGGILNLSGGLAIADVVAVTVNSGGTLTLQTSETIGSLAGSGATNLNSRTLTTGGNNTDTVFTGPISGAGGSLFKTGTGTFTLSGANTYGGTTTVNMGTLTLQNGAAIADSGAVTVAAPGTLNLATSETIGSLEGDGFVTLNSNTLTTGGNGVATVFGGVMSGTGRLVKDGAGIFTLSGANTFTGPVTVNGGNLILFGGAALADNVAVTLNSPGGLVLQTSETIGSLAGGGPVNLLGNTLTTGGNNTSTAYGGAFSGAGGVVKNGTGTFTLTGNSTHTGGTTLNAGAIAAGSAGALGQGGFTMNGGTLRNAGTPVAVNVGTGSIAFNGGTFVAQVGGTSAGVNHDQLRTTGTANISGGTLSLVQQGGYVLAPGDKVRLLLATGGVAGGSTNGTKANNATGLAAFTNTPLLVPTVNLYTDAVILEAMQGSFAALIGTLPFTPNQSAAAGALDSLTAVTGGKTGVFAELDFLSTQPLSTLQSNLNKISPDELTVIFSISRSLSITQANNLLQHLDAFHLRNSGGGSAFGVSSDSAQAINYTGFEGPKGKAGKEVAPAPEERFGLFMVGSGEFTRVGSTTNAAGYRYETGGVTAGLDYRLTDHFVVGMSLGYFGTSATLENGGSLDADGGRVGVYASYFDRGFYMDAALNGGFNSYKTRRVTPNNTSATASPDGSEVNVLFATGYDWKAGCVTFGPTFTYEYTGTHLHGFTETGAFAPLNVHGGNAESSRTALGFRASCERQIAGKAVRPEVRAAWMHEFGDTEHQLTSSFATLGGVPFTASGPVTGRDSLRVGAGVTVQWNERLAVYLNYDGEVGRKNYESHSVSGGFRLQF